MDGCTHNLGACYHLIRSFMTFTLSKFRVKPVSRHGLQLPRKTTTSDYCCESTLHLPVNVIGMHSTFFQLIMAQHMLESKTDEKKDCIQTG